MEAEAAPDLAQKGAGDGSFGFGCTGGVSGGWGGRHWITSGLDCRTGSYFIDDGELRTVSTSLDY
jgi:hypothetical protein